MENNENEIWLDIKGYEGIYKISNLGNVYSLKRNKLLLPKMDRYGYVSVKLYKNGNHQKYNIHRLVAISFIPNPFNKETVNHINGIKNDNRMDNLEWATYKENTQHAIRTGLFLKEKTNSKRQSHPVKLTKENVKEIRDLYNKGKHGFGYVSLAKKYNVSRSLIREIVKNKIWQE